MQIGSYYHRIRADSLGRVAASRTGSVPDSCHSCVFVETGLVYPVLSCCFFCRWLLAQAVLIYASCHTMGDPVSDYPW